ncbi:hypothetical protein BDW22DRAFT_1344271 [Trametopsis cervina]|nr:hypothetical protein BDW22DRAFT_1344271 [Trametopsis cervina]
MHAAKQRPFVPGLWHGRPTTPEQSDETDEYSDEGYDSEYDDEYSELHEPVDRGFRIGDKVWIRIRKTWYNGIVRQIATPEQTKDGRSQYHVYFRRKNTCTNMRACVHPLDGNVKPDNFRTRRLLSDSGARIGSLWDAL